MKKLIFTCAAIVALQVAAMCQIRFGITAGSSLANMFAKMDGEKDHGKMKAGFTAGVMADIPAGKHCSFQPALNFVQKGTRDESTDGGTTMKAKLNLNYVEIPLNVLYQSNGITGSFFIGGGPSLSFGLSGKATYEEGGEKTSDKVHFGNSDEDDLKGFEFGANVLTGYQSSNGFLVALNYNAGLSNLLPGGSNDGKLRNSYFGIRLGYLFRDSKK